MKPFPSVRELWERIKADGLRIALASSARKEELERYKQIAGIADLVDAETSSDDAEKSKPHPDIFEAALDRLEDAAGDAIAVGDTPYDAQAAGKAGLARSGCSAAAGPKGAIREAGCIAIYRDPADLLRHHDHPPWPAADPDAAHGHLRPEQQEVVWSLGHARISRAAGIEITPRPSRRLREGLSSPRRITYRKAMCKLLGWVSARPDPLREAEEATHSGTMPVPRQDSEDRDAQTTG